jgi:hypothetical protein
LQSAAAAAGVAILSPLYSGISGSATGGSSGDAANSRISDACDDPTSEDPWLPSFFRQSGWAPASWPDVTIECLKEGILNIRDGFWLARGLVVSIII